MELSNNETLEAPLLRRMKTNEKMYLDEFFKEEKGVPKSVVKLFSENWKAGITVGLVNLPLSISLAVASGSTPMAGIMSGVIAGIISGLLGGSNYNIVGPTGALSGFLSVCCFKYGIGSLAYFSMLVGVLAFVVRIYHLEKYIDLFPTAVNEGFTVGVALIIFFNQMGSALGIGTIKKDVYSTVDNETLDKINKVIESQTQESMIHNFINNLEHLDQVKMSSLTLFITFFLALFFLIRKYPKVPWMIVSAVFGILIGHSLAVDTLKTKFGELHMQLFDFSYYSEVSPFLVIDPRFFVDGLPIAFIAILETLISAKIADGMTATRFNKRKELDSLALCNILSGLFGGIPVTAALARTSLNIKSGATHRFSALINGMVLLVLGVVLIRFFTFLPMAVVAAQVCIVAVRMVNYDELHHMYIYDKKNFSVAITIAVICVLKDPTVGIIFGMLIYLIFFCENLIEPWNEIILTHEKKRGCHSPMKQQSKLNILDTLKDSNLEIDNREAFLNDVPLEEGDFAIYRIIGIINFMNVDPHIKKIKALGCSERHFTVVISLRYMHFIDKEALDSLKLLLDKLDEELHNCKKKYILTGISHSKLEKIKDIEWIKRLRDNNQIIESYVGDFEDSKLHTI